MELLDKDSWGNGNPQLREDELRRKRDEDLRDDDKIINSDIPDSGLPEHDSDNQHRTDDDLKGRDLDVDNTDEYDADSMNDVDLDADDLRDDDDVNYDLHQIKNDEFGSLASAIGDQQNPDDHDKG